MKLSIVIPVSHDDSDYRTSVLPVLCDLVEPEDEPAVDGRRYLARTWDPATGSPVAHVVFDDLDTRRADELLDVITTRHADWSTTLGSDDVLPPPHWNSGFAGSAFDEVSRGLGQRTTPVLVDLARSVRATGAVPGPLQAVSLMVTHAAASLRRSPQRDLPGRDFASLLALRLLSYRSHYEAILLRTADPEAFEAACAAFYAQVGPSLRDAITQAGSTPDLPATDGVAGAWDDAIVRESPSIARHLLDGTIVDAGRTLEDLERELGSPVPPTRFHAPPTPHMTRLLHDDLDFVTYRVLTTVLYSGLHTAGFSLGERYVFCYAVARASEELAGKGMLDLQADLDALALDLRTGQSPTVAPVTTDTAPPEDPSWT